MMEKAVISKNNFLRIGGGICLAVCVLVVGGCSLISARTQPPALSCDALQRIDENRFGFVNASRNFSAVSTLGAQWNQSFPGPFVWDTVQAERNQPFDFEAADEDVMNAQGIGEATLGILWPYASWDQRGHGLRRECAGSGHSESLPKDRCKPADTQAYVSFVTEVVERYDGDGLYDAEGLCVPIRHWESVPQVHLQNSIGGIGMFHGTPTDYYNVLRTTFRGVKGACPQCDIHIGAIDAFDGKSVQWLDDVLLLGGAEFFDAVSVHTHASSAAEDLLAVRNVLESYHQEKPIWVTELTVDGTEADDGSKIVRGSIESFAAGAQKVFFSALDTDPEQVPSRFMFSLLDGEGNPRPAYTAVQTLIRMLGTFTGVEKIDNGIYLFNTKKYGEVYAVWDAGGVLPDGFAGEMHMSRLDGTEEVLDAGDIQLSNAPIFLYK
ncbi:MAG: hypothetical protein WC289_02815 [Patescibacteria group bacterium]|jgi:hypothetical protein